MYRNLQRHRAVIPATARLLFVLTVVCMYKPIGKVVIELLQGSGVIQTVSGGLTICPLVANFLYCICAKTYENAGSRQSYCKNYQAYFFGPPCTFTLCTWGGGVSATIV